jgi:putative transposase
VNRKRVQRLMRLMGIAALGPKPRTSKPAPGHRIYPYLLRNLTIGRANHVWAADITYIPIGRGFLYLVAIIDWASRAVLAWRLSNTMDVSFCLAALEEARAKFGKPEIFNTDQGSQFTSVAFTGALAQAGVAISMDGRGRWVDSVFIERLWPVDEVRGHLSQKLRRRPRSRAGSPNGSPSTTSGARTKRSPTARRWRSGAKRSPAPRLWT